MVTLPRVIAELFPAIMGLIAAGAGYGLARYTKRQTHHR
jgi:hypothetical protein